MPCRMGTSYGTLAAMWRQRGLSARLAVNYS